MAEETTITQENESRTSVMEHLKELRKRLMYSCLGILVGLVAGLILCEIVTLDLLMAPGVKVGIEFIAIDPTETMSVFFRVGLVSGIIFAMPLLVYQLFAFIGPALTSREKRFIYSILPAITLMFLLGVAFAYFIALPPMLEVLHNFLISKVNPQFRISSYINIVTRVLLVVGLIFETPLIIMGLARLGLVTPQWLAARRKWWILLAFILSAVISPTMDVITQTIFAVPMILLLELGIILARLVQKKADKPKKTAKPKKKKKRKQDSFSGDW